MTDYGNGAFFCIANMILDSELLLIIILVYNILTIGTRLTPRCTIIASLLFRAYARASRHVYFNLHPASSNVGVLECSKTVYRCSAFSNFFLPPNEERKQTLFEVYWGLNASLYCSQQALNNRFLLLLSISGLYVLLRVKLALWHHIRNGDTIPSIFAQNRGSASRQACACVWSHWGNMDFLPVRSDLQCCGPLGTEPGLDLRRCGGAIHGEPAATSGALAGPGQSRSRSRAHQL